MTSLLSCLRLRLNISASLEDLTHLSLAFPDFDPFPRRRRSCWDTRMFQRRGGGSGDAGDAFLSQPTGQGSGGGGDKQGFPSSHDRKWRRCQGPDQKNADMSLTSDGISPF